MLNAQSSAVQVSCFMMRTEEQRAHMPPALHLRDGTAEPAGTPVSHGHHQSPSAKDEELVICKVQYNEKVEHSIKLHPSFDGIACSGPLQPPLVEPLAKMDCLSVWQIVNADFAVSGDLSQSEYLSSR